MSTYLGYIYIMEGNDSSNRSIYYNFNPIAEVKNGELIPLSISQVRDLLPLSRYPNITFRFNFSSAIEHQTMREMMYHLSLVLFDFQEEELSVYQTNSPTPGYYVQAYNLIQNEKIRPIWGDGIYYLLSPEEYSGDLTTDRTVYITGSYEPGDKVMLESDEYSGYFGPFEILEGPDGLFIVVNPEKKKYVLEALEDADIEVLNIYDFEKKSNYDIPVLIRNSNAKTVSYDVSRDEHLLNAYDSLVPKPGMPVSEREEVLSGAAVFSKELPKQIRDQRFNRLKDLLDRRNETNQLEEQEENKEPALETAGTTQRHSDPNFLERPTAKNATSDLLNALLHPKTASEYSLDKAEPLDFTKDISKTLKSLSRKNLGKIPVSRSLLNSSQEEMMDEYQKLVEITSELRSRNLDAERILEQDDLSEQISMAQSQLETLENLIDEREDHLESLQEESQQLQLEKEELSRQLEDIETQFDKLIEEKSQSLVSLAYDTYLSNKLMSSLAAMQTKEEKEKLEEAILALNELKTDFRSNREIIDYLVRTIQKQRPSYSKNTILNLFICLFQNLLTVLSGEPGSGKTSISNIIGKTLGLDLLKDAVPGMDLGRYLSISVEKGWTSKRDLIGYYNPLTKTFDKANLPLYNAFTLLDQEKKKNLSSFPFVVLLDEANLSPMEYYWSDFMKLTDLEADSPAAISLGEDFIFEIPDTFHFLATINNDQTTEILSPRLIDRSFVITLPKPRSLVQEGRSPLPEEIRLVPWKNLKQIFVPDEKTPPFSRKALEIYSLVVDKFKEKRFDVSPRINQAVINYTRVAQNLFEREGQGATPEEIALDYAISQKLLPKISGNGERFKTWLSELEVLLRRSHLYNSEKTVREILQAGNEDMQYYRFFR